jgi:coenzyme PQQ precursor peptide PqqA
MMRRLGAARRTLQHGVRDGEVPAGALRCLCHPSGDPPMQWQTPTAIDLRFGFEITMYVANR